jgi:hypothetical protein
MAFDLIKIYNFIMKKIILTTVLASLALTYGSLYASEDMASYIVKTDNEKVYIDTTKYDKEVLPGQTFKIIEKGEDLVNPVTGENLGQIPVNVGAGIVRQVMEKFAVGQITFKEKDVKIGQIVVWDSVQAQASQTNANATQENKPMWSSKPLKTEIYTIALGNITGDEENEVVCAFKYKLVVYALHEGELKELYSLKFPKTKQIVAVNTMDLMGEGHDQIFVTYHNLGFNRVETYVVKVQDDKLKKPEVLKWMVSTIKSPSGKKRIFAQELFSNEAFSQSKIRELKYENGKFELTGNELDVPRFDWVYGFNRIDLDKDDKEDTVFITDSNRIRVQFEERSNYWQTDNVFGRTPNRIEWKGERIPFAQKLPLRINPNGRIETYAIVNYSSVGVLAEAFGRYNKGKLQVMTWDDNALQFSRDIDLHGYASDLDSGRFGNLPEGLIVPVITSGGKTIIKVFNF